MGRNAANEQFNIKIANTDNDTRERKALGFWWPDILLLLCIFHTWQSWRNALNKYLVGIPKGEARQTICSRLGRLLMHLLKEICDYDKAIAAYNQELTIFKDLKTKSDELLRKQGKAGLMFLAYLQGHLKLRSMWLSWSPAGAIEAARRLDVPVSKIACTTNHLKSFNHHIKGKYLASYVRSRRLPRIDYWIQIIITEAIPHFFAEWHKKRNLADYQQFIRMEAPREQANTMTKPVHPSKDAIERRLDDESKVSQVQFETEMLEQLAEHSLNDTNDVPDDVPDMQDGYGLPLVPEHCTDKTSFSIEVNNNASFSDDLALDDSAIVADLSGNWTLPFPFTSAQPTSTQFDFAFPSLFSPPETPEPQTPDDSSLDLIAITYDAARVPNVPQLNIT